MGDPSRSIHRLGVIEQGEAAVRILTAVTGLNSDTGAPPVSTVLVSVDAGSHPWYSREADEVLAVPRLSPTVDLVGAVQGAGIDSVWVGDVPDRTELIDAFGLAGLVVVGPQAATVRSLADPLTVAALAGAAGLDATTGSAEDCRIIEVDVLCDDFGAVWCLEPRDVTLHAGDQLMVAESPIPGVDADLLGAAAARIARHAGYRGAGTVVFTERQGAVGLTSFDTIAAPLHATTEERTGMSLIGLRVRLARGEPLPGRAPAGTGVAMEARLLAVDVHSGLSRTTGRVALLSFPAGTGVRVDANRRVGDPVEAADPLLAVITAWGPDREVARQRLRRAVARTSVVIEGGTTNRSFLLDLLGRTELSRAGSEAITSSWLDSMIAGASPAPPDPVALLAAAVEAYEADRRVAEDAFFAAAGRGRPEQPPTGGTAIDLSYRGVDYSVQVDRTRLRHYSVRAGDTVADLVVDRLNDFERRIGCGGRRYRVVVTTEETSMSIELDGAAHVVTRTDGVVVRAGWPALVVASLVSPGQQVTAGTPVAVLESMKMETTVTAPFAGEVVAVSITANTQVERGAPMLRIRPPAAATVGVGEAVSLAGLERRADFSRKPCERVYDSLGAYLLGFDLAPAELRKVLTQQRRLAEITDAADPALLACEDGLLDIYADLGALYRPKAEADEESENTQEYLAAFLQWLDVDRAGLPGAYQDRLKTALGRYGIPTLEPTPELRTVLMALFRSVTRLTELAQVVAAILERRLANRDALAPIVGTEYRGRLARLAKATRGRQQAIADLAGDVEFHYFDAPPLEQAAAGLEAEMAGHFAALGADLGAADRDERMERLVWCPLPMRSLMLETWRGAGPTDVVRDIVLETYIRRFYRIRPIGRISFGDAGPYRYATCDYVHDDSPVTVVVAYLRLDDVALFSAALTDSAVGLGAGGRLVVDLVTWRSGPTPPIDEAAAAVTPLVATTSFVGHLDRLDLTITNDVTADHHPGDLNDEHLRTQNLTYRRLDDGAFAEDMLYRNLHPMLAKRLEIWRLSNFDLERRPSPEDVYLFLGVAKSNRRDRRLFALAEVRDLNAVTDTETGRTTYPRLERTVLVALAAMRAELTRFAAADRPTANRMVLSIGSPWTVSPDDRAMLAERFAPLVARVGLEKVVVRVQIPSGDRVRDAVLHFEGAGRTVIVREDTAGHRPVNPLSPYKQKVLTAARFGSPYPYEIVKLFARLNPPRPGLPADSFVELDLDRDDPDLLIPVERPPGNNAAHVVIGEMINHTPVVPEGVRRVAILSDPTQGLGNLAEPECRRINAALAYAAENRLPVEWFAVSSGALIAMDSGTENMDWIALTLRRLIEFTQDGGEVNIIVTGINVGGQPYWNAEATMLTHTKGILIMTPASAMVLTGKQALDFSGAVSAEDNFGIGGYDRVMGPNGQAQYWAPSFTDACRLLLRHYDLTYVVPGERFPRPQPTFDPPDRDVRLSPHAELPGGTFTTVGDVFSAELNPERKQPFDMRSVMRAVADSDSRPLERWRDMRDGDTSIVWDTTVGGQPVLMLGLESHSVGRKGFVPADGPPSWTSGTLFPHSSRKSARAINAASGNRPMVVLANLSGFDGSPESMRRRQLEFGAEIGRAVTNFDGPIVFVVVSRYHGGAFVVFSKALNEAMEIAAVEGSFASVIGGAPAAATVFAREVKQRTEADRRVVEAREAATAGGAEAASLRAHLGELTALVRSEKLGEVADEFDAIHTIERAQRVGSVDRIVAAADLRPYVIDALARGMAKWSPTGSAGPRPAR